MRGLWELHGGNARQPVRLPGKAVTVEVLLDDAWHVRHPVKDDELVQRAVAIRELTARSVVLGSANLRCSIEDQRFGVTVVLVDTATA